MNRIAARAIVGVAGGISVVLLGHAIRGPYAAPSVARDAAAGAAVTGCVLALTWAMGELAGDTDA